MVLQAAAATWLVSIQLVSSASEETKLELIEAINLRGFHSISFLSE